MKRVHIFISGNVTGVFFRANIRDNALSLNLTGFVKNRNNKTVEAVFEGEEKDVKEILNFCKKGPEGAEVENLKVVKEKFKGEFESFEIKYNSE